MPSISVTSALVTTLTNNEVSTTPQIFFRLFSSLYALWVPRQIVVDDQRAELKIDPLGGSLGGDHDYGFVMEILDQRGPHVGGL